MTNVVPFVPKHEASAKENLAAFIHCCRTDLTVFGAELDWEASHWPSAGVTFGNINQTSRKLDHDKVMLEPFLTFAKAYLRYQQGISPKRGKWEMGALKCMEAALLMEDHHPDISRARVITFDEAAVVACRHYSPNAAYHYGRELARLANFLDEKKLRGSLLSWKSPIKKPADMMRTGTKARERREKRLPSQEALEALAAIFSASPRSARDIFTSSLTAMLLCAPSRVSEVLELPEDCEIRQTKRDGTEAYGWRFVPGKGAAPLIKWIPTAMVSLAQEAIARIRTLSAEGRKIALWLEKHPGQFYRHAGCPNVDEDKPLTIAETAAALGMEVTRPGAANNSLQELGLPSRSGENTLRALNTWLHTKLPEDFPYFDKHRKIRYSEALFCLQKNQLHPTRTTSPSMVWKPRMASLNADLGPLVGRDSIFTRHATRSAHQPPLKLTSHQFRHYLNTVAQRGGLSQSQIARWSGRKDLHQNRVYDHMSEFELVGMLREHDKALSLDQPTADLAKQVAALMPVSQQEFNTLSIPTAHVTEFGFCVHDYAMSPCERFRDCLNCTEHLCIKGDRRAYKLSERLGQVQALKAAAEKEIAEGSAGADRWYEVHTATEERLKKLVALIGNRQLPAGAVIRLANSRAFSPLGRAMSAKASRLVQAAEIAMSAGPYLQQEGLDTHG